MPAVVWYKTAMVIEPNRELIPEEPFRPFEIRMVSVEWIYCCRPCLSRRSEASISASVGAR